MLRIQPAVQAFKDAWPEKPHVEREGRAVTLGRMQTLDIEPASSVPTKPPDDASSTQHTVTAFPPLDHCGPALRLGDDFGGGGGWRDWHAGGRCAVSQGRGEAAARGMESSIA
jgi:hypothetical protein